MKISCANAEIFQRVVFAPDIKIVIKIVILIFGERAKLTVPIAFVLTQEKVYQ